MRLKHLSRLICLFLLALGIAAPAQSPSGQSPSGPSRADILRGEYGPWRANNDLLSYDLDIRVDPEKKFISGKNTIRFKMLKDDTRIQLDLFANLNVDKILLGGTELKYARELGTVFVDFPAPLKKGSVQSIEFNYSGSPQETGRFGGIRFGKDPAGRDWITTACQGTGASVWWPNKDQQQDEVENMRLRLAIPSSLTDVSNGRLVGKTDLGDGYTRYDWAISYPINNYCVSLNIGHYEHFSDKLGDLTMDFYCLPENLEKAKRQFAQAGPMIEAFQKYFGEYPFKRDGYKLIEVPYSGMEHQSAVTYGNRFANGYLERDWTGVGVSLKFDFIIIHESAHEWFGNAITGSDISDMWIQEGWATYAECVYVEALFGKEDALKYTNGYKPKVRNQHPIITTRGVNETPSQDQYFKGALFLNTLRSVVNDDARWWKLMRAYYDRFKYRNIMTEDVVAFFNQQTGKNLTPIFDQYLRRAALPALELRSEEGGVSYRWKTDIKDFAMPVKVGKRANWQLIQPTTEWKTMKTGLKKEEFEVATDLYYIDVVWLGQGDVRGNDEAAIREVVSKYVDARERIDPKATEELFTSDADQLVSSGEWRKGRDAVVRGAMASSNSTGGKRTITVESVRFVTPDVAIADGRYELTGLAGGATRSMWATLVLKRTEKGWSITAIRNMLPAAPAPGR